MWARVWKTVAAAEEALEAEVFLTWASLGLASTERARSLGDIPVPPVMEEIVAVV